MVEQHENKPIWRELEKDKILDDLRHEKMEKMYEAIKDADIATDPMAVK